MLFQSPDLRLSAADSTATLWLDRAGSTANWLSLRMLRDLARALHDVGKLPGLEVLVLRSAKVESFVAGHDPHELATFRTESDWLALASLTQLVTGRLERLAQDLRTVAYLDGPCLGPGLELALACEYRLALCRPTTRLGFEQSPTLGLPPWGGGTARLVRRLGLGASLPLLLGSRRLTGRQARAAGLVDHAFCERIAVVELRAFVDRLRQQQRPRRSWPWAQWRRFGPLSRWRLNAALARRSSEGGARSQAVARSIGSGLRNGFAAGLAEERRGLCETAAAGVAPRLRLACAAARAAEGPCSRMDRPLGLVGASITAAELAALALLRGRRVVWYGADEATRQRCRVHLEQAHREGMLTPLERDTLLNKRLSETTDGTALEIAELIVDVATGPDDRRRARLRRILDRTTGPITVALAGVESRLTGWRKIMPQRVRLVRVHFAGPVYGGAVVEIVAPNDAPGMVRDQLTGWARGLGLLPIGVSDQPGPFVSRVRRSLRDEAARLLTEGVPVEELEDALLQIGLTAHQQFQEISAVYHRTTAGAPRPRPGEARERLLLTLVNAAAAALGEGRASSAEQIDLALAVGAGLLRQFGGPLSFADAHGLRAVIVGLERLARYWGARFAPCAELVRRAITGEPFYGRATAGPRLAATRSGALQSSAPLRVAATRRSSA